MGKRVRWFFSPPCHFHIHNLSYDKPSVHFRMVRNYIKKTRRAETPRHMKEQGVNEIISMRCSVRSAAKEIGLNNYALGHYVKQVEGMGSRYLNIGYRPSQRVFSDEQETVLQDYLVRAANIYFGLSPKDVRVLAYDCAFEIGVDVPPQ